MITAWQAKELAGKTVEEKVRALEDAIRKEATAKKHFLSMGPGRMYTDDADLWSRKDLILWKEAKRLLEGLGYKVFFQPQESLDNPGFTYITW